MGPNQAVKVVKTRPTRFASAVLPQLSANADHDASMMCLDLVQISFADNPYDWTWGVLSEAGVYTWGHTIGLNLRESWQFVTWAFGSFDSPRVYTVEYAESLGPSQIAALYGLDAASSARKDYKAVQLALTRAS